MVALIIYVSLKIQQNMVILQYNINMELSFAFFVSLFIKNFLKLYSCFFAKLNEKGNWVSRKQIIL